MQNSDSTSSDTGVFWLVLLSNSYSTMEGCLVSLAIVFVMDGSPTKSFAK